MSDDNMLLFKLADKFQYSVVLRNCFLTIEEIDFQASSIGNLYVKYSDIKSILYQAPEPEKHKPFKSRIAITTRDMLDDTESYVICSDVVDDKRMQHLRKEICARIEQALKNSN